MSAAAAELLKVLQDLFAFLPVVTFLLVCWLASRVEESERRLAHARIEIYTLVEQLHDHAGNPHMIQAGMMLNWPELRLVSEKHRRPSKFTVERAS